MSYRDATMVPGDWHPNDFRIGDRFYLDLGSDAGTRPFTVTGIDPTLWYFNELRLRVDWDDPEMVGDVFPNLQWIGFCDGTEE